VPEVDLVQVEVEDLLLAEVLLDVAREDHLAQLAAIAPLGREQQRLHHLLRDRAAALPRLAGEQVHPRAGSRRSRCPVLKKVVLLATKAARRAADSAGHQHAALAVEF
jgi:hypothetical protein